MFGATVSVPAANAADTLRNLINAAVPGQIPPTYDGRCIQIILERVSTDVDVNWRPGSVASPVGAADSVFTLTTAVPSVTLSAVTGNQISIDEVFLSSAAVTPTAKILVLVA